MSTDEDREWDAYLERMTPPEEDERERAEEEAARAEFGDPEDDDECQACGGDGIVFGPTPGGWGQPAEYRCTACAPERQEP